ncbi:MAG: hypothetical protein N3F64_00100 [Nitrososphaeria archaeon]|nr:hypothetical protein [Nitrososphaeria archaeon]
MKQNISKLLYSMPLISFIIGYIYYFIILMPSDRTPYTIVEMVFKDPFIFILGFIGIIIGTFFDKINGFKTEIIVQRIEKVAILWLVIGFIISALVTGFKPIQLFYLVIEGKFLILQPLMIIFYSLILPLGKSFLVNIGLKNILKAIILMLMAFSPAYIFYTSLREGQTMQNYLNGLAILTVAFILYIVLNLKMLEKRIILRG